MKQVTILSGLPGSGKSLFAETFFPTFFDVPHKIEICSADHYMVNVIGEYHFDPSRLSKCHQACFRRFMRAMDLKVDSICVDNTNLSAWEIAPYYLAAEAYGYLVEILVIECDPEVAFARQRHGVCRATFDRMLDKLRNEVFPQHWVRKSVFR